ARSWCEEVIGFCGLKPKMHQKAQDLTIADRKRLELARAVATAPKLILLDEVAAGLNPSEIDEVIRIIKDLKGLGIGAVVGVEHVMRFIMEISDRIIVMHHGKKISEGRPEEVVRDEKVLEAYLGKSYAQA
ncbi:ABC transporter ATP-binding protein, partial [candidate division WOR-3 bacterium]